MYGVRRSGLSQVAPVLRSSCPPGNMLFEQRAVERRAVDEERIGRELAVARARIGGRRREVHGERRGERRAGVEAADQLEVRLVVEAAVAAADHALAAAEVVGHADARLEVVLVDRILLDQRIVGLGNRDDLEVVAQRRGSA